MAGVSPDRGGMTARRNLLRAVLAVAGAAMLAACGGVGTPLETLSAPTTPPSAEPPPPGLSAPAGGGAVRVALVLPLSAAGNAGVAATSMKNAAEMAIEEFRNPNIQLLVKDDGGTPAGAQQA